MKAIVGCSLNGVSQVESGPSHLWPTMSSHLRHGKWPALLYFPMFFPTTQYLPGSEPVHLCLLGSVRHQFERCLASR